MSDLDDEELEATRRLNGVAKKDDIEKDIQRQTKNTINYYKDLEKIEEIPIDILRAMYKDVLAERKQDKQRIKELEEENKIYVQNGNNVKLEIYIKNNYIPVQKVKDKIEELKNAKRETTRENWHYIYTIQLKILEELLERE